MNSPKLLPKLFSLYNTLAVSRAKIHCTCRLLCIQQSLKLTTKLNSFAVQCRSYSEEAGPSKKDEDSQNKEIAGARLSNYTVFQDSDSPIILDVDEERRLLEENPEHLQDLQQKVKTDRFFGMNLKRGETGVFDIEELVDVLKNENASNIITIAIPEEYRYVDYMVIVSGRSFKHLCAMAEYVKKLFKLKRSESDRIPKIEGYELYATEPSDWLAMDLGNITLHLFLEPVRRKYDLETLWAVGKEFDDLYQAKETDYISMLKEHTVTSLDDLVPLDAPSFPEQEKLA